MTDTPSLALLKGKNADIPAAEDAGQDGPIDAVEDIKKASAKALEHLLKENETPPPEGWVAMKLADKRAWVLAKFEAEAASQSAAEAVGDDATVGQTSAATDAPAPQTKPKGKGKKAKEPEAKTVEQIADANGGLPVAEQDQGTDADEAPGSGEDPPFEADPPAEPAATQLAAEAAAANPKPAKTKGKKKGQELALAPKEGEILSADPIKDIVHEVENMDKKTALDLVAELNEQADIAFFRLGGILSLVSSNGWWKTEDNKYETFRAYIEQEHGLEYRKATYWIAIYNALAKSDVPWEKIKTVGWTKLKEIAKVLTVENVDDWVGKAEKVNTLTLHAMVKKETEGGSSDDGTPVETEKVTTKTFKVHAGQKEVIEAAIKKAKETSGTEVDTMALEYICQDFLGGSGAQNSSMTPAQQLSKLVKSLDLEIVMHVVDETFPEFDFTVDKKEAGEETAA